MCVCRGGGGVESGVLLILILVRQGPTVFAVDVWISFPLAYLTSFLSPSLWETARYRLKYCLKATSPNQPTNQPTFLLIKLLANLCRLIQRSEQCRKSRNSLITKTQATKFSSAKLKKNKSKLYHTENSKTRGQTV